MIPQVPNLNINWEGDPGIRQRSDAAAGVQQYFVNPLNEIVKERREQERQLDNSFHEIIKQTNGRYIGDVMQMVPAIRNQIKEASRGRWNSPEARMARTNALMQLSAASQKASYVAGIPDKLAQRKTDRYLLYDNLRADVEAELNKSLNDIDVDRVERMLTSDAYTNMDAKASDALDETIGKDVNMSPTFEKRSGEHLFVQQIQYRNNFRLKKKDDGTPFINPLTNEPEIENNIDDEALIKVLSKMSGGKTDPSTGLPTAYKYYEDLYARTSPDSFKLLETEGKTKQDVVLDLFRTDLNKRIMAPSYKEVAARTDPRDWYGQYNVSRGDDPDVISRNNLNQSIVNIVNSIRDTGKVTLLNTFLESEGNSLPAIYSTSFDDGYIIQRGKDKVINIAQLANSQSTRKYVNIVNGKATLSEEGQKMYAPWKGLSVTIKGSGSSGNTYRTFTINNDQDLGNAIGQIMAPIWGLKSNRPTVQYDRSGNFNSPQLPPSR